MVIETDSFEAYNRMAQGTNWTLLAGSGDREYYRNIAFKKIFSKPPEVIVGLSMLDVSPGTNDRVRVNAENITQRDFDIVFSTWSDAKGYGLHGNWIAIEA